MAFRKIPRLKGIKKDSRAVQKTNTSAVMPETDGLDLSMPTLERSGIKNRISSVMYAPRLSGKVKMTGGE